MEKSVILITKNLTEINKEKFEEQLKDYKITYIDNIKDLNKINYIEADNMNDKIVEIISNIVEFRNLESGNHVKRVKSFTNTLAKYMANVYPEYNLNNIDINIITSASALHDVGKIVISDNILLKRGKLSKEEFEIMKTHTTNGCIILNMLNDVLKEKEWIVSYEICKYHHERYDGNGYPEHLKGEQIPISAQIVSIADVYDALVHERIYKEAFPVDVAYNMIQNGECGTFSPKLMKCFSLARKEFETIVKNEN